MAAGWDGLLGILQEARQDSATQQAQRPISCPLDGTLLLTGPHSELYCPFCGHQPDHSEHP